MNSLCVFTEDFFNYRFGPEHPFNPLRLQLWLELLQDAGLLEKHQMVHPRPATMAELLAVHSEDYLRAVQQAGAGVEPVPGLERYGLGTDDNPVFPHMHEAAALITGATLVAAELVMEGKAEHALNMAGGLHHAHRGRASGFCIYNDAAVAIAWLQRRYGIRVAYIDTDAHHGDGVQAIFYDDPDVLTISFHEDGRYLFPGTGSVGEMGKGDGLGYCLNFPLEPFTEDDSLLEVMDAVLPQVLRAFRPDLIISQHGCDGHRLDPLTHLALTGRSYREIPRLVHRLAHQFAGGRWVALGGGGYDIWRVVPVAWAMLWAEMADRQLPSSIPQRWLNRWQSRSPEKLPLVFTGNIEEDPPIPRRAEISDKNTATLNRLCQNHLLMYTVFPAARGGLWGY